MDPVVLVSYAANGRTTGLGARRRCEFNDDGTRWVEEHIAARELTAGTTEVTMTADLAAAGPIKKVIAGAGSLALRRVLDQLLAGLAHHIATGDDAADLKQLRRA